MDANQFYFNLVGGIVVSAFGLVLGRVLRLHDEQSKKVNEHDSRIASVETMSENLSAVTKEIQDNVRLLVQKAMEGK